ncbi:MAG: hypothetical protein GVY10_07675 [Verrucomicrobia bacterium]|jgi:hypothetical protein|nr:hypothetical protein [Verrucomicrobiota bacterium]
MALLDVRFFAESLGVSTSMQVLLSPRGGPGTFAAVARLSGALDLNGVRERFVEEGRRAKMAAIFGASGEAFDAESRDLFRLTMQAASGSLNLPRM